MKNTAILFVFLLPLVHSQDGIKFFYYSKVNPDIPIEFEATHIPLLGYSIVQSKGNPRVKILCHGWMANSTVNWVKPMVAKYLQSGESNVITVDWGIYAYQMYPLTLMKVPSVGQTVGEAIVNIIQQWNVSYSDFHLIGHSTGAHAMGFAGKYIIKKGYGKVGRITALDPAGPGYNFVFPSMRLSNEDANFVDVIHTNSGGLGHRGTLGQLDFWPNGGKTQPGCDPKTNCNHIRAPAYFIESIASKAFPSWQCQCEIKFNEGDCFQNQMIYMGEWAPSFIRGKFYLRTNGQPPFGTINIVEENCNSP